MMRTHFNQAVVDIRLRPRFGAAPGGSHYIQGGPKTSKLLILSKFVDKTEKIGKREQIRTATKKMKHCLIFSREIFYVAIIVLWLNIL